MLVLAFASQAAGSSELVSSSVGCVWSSGNVSLSVRRFLQMETWSLFESTANNLVPDDTDSISDVYVRNRLTGETILVSRASSTTGAKGDGASHDPAISADGRFVAFSSDAENLIPGGSGAEHVYVRDLAANTTILVDRGSGPASVISDAIAGAPSTNLTGGSWHSRRPLPTSIPFEDANAFVDIYLRDLQSETTTLITRGANGQASDENSSDPLISATAARSPSSHGRGT